MHLNMNTPIIDIESLLDQLTLEEQVSLLAGADFWTTVSIPRLGIASVKVSDGPNGARGGIFKDGPSTACFPVGIALASTWNPALVQQTGAALGVEAKLKGARVLLAPTINLHRTVLNGRNFECYSEDPWLSSEMAVAYVRGLQSTGVGAAVKHFVGNDSEYQRMSISCEIPERALRELYLLPFERAVKEAGVMAVMTGYNRIDSIYMADHHRFVNDILRKQWGFDGLVMTDWFAHHDTVKSVQAGADLEMPGPTRQRGTKLVTAVQDGRVAPAAIRACARRVLQLAQRLGSFSDPQLVAERADDLPAHRALIRKLGSEGSVLLKNDAGALPLAVRAGQTIALIGRAATVPQIMGGGSATVNAHYRVAAADALKQALPGVTFTQHQGADLHRYIPVLSSPITIELFNSTDLSGPVVATQTSPNSEVMWMESIPAGINREAFSARIRIPYVATVTGAYAFSLVSAGVSRAFINGDLAIDAWTQWQRGDTYFTWGCNEVIHHRSLRAGEAIELVVEYCAVTPDKENSFRALRIGASRILDDTDIEAAVTAAKSADIAIVFAGLNAEWDNEGLDRPNMDLPHRQNELIERVVAANPRTVVVLQTGSPVGLPWLNRVPAVLQAWYPGQECGNAIADVLLGRADPGGRLPQTWPLRLEDTVGYGDPLQYPGVDGHVHYNEGVFIGYRHYQQRALPVQFPFGYGLSYARFALSEIQQATASIQSGGHCSVDVEVSNLSDRAGQTVVQLYVHHNNSQIARPKRELKAFVKLDLAAGEKATATMLLCMRSFAYFDEAQAAWVARKGSYQLEIGFNAEDLPLATTVMLQDDWIEALSPGAPG